MDDSRRRARSIVNVAATLAGLVVAAMLLHGVDAGGSSGTIGVYLASNWQAPFGISLVADRLSALMLVLVGIVGLGSALYAEAGWARAGAYFHPLFQIQLMGLNGAFLTGDLFNLFVFFEVLLAASYGLHLHGSGWPRVRSGLHYIAVNLLASLLFLVGLAVLYGVVGTLSMADLADKVAQVPVGDRGLLHVGAAILAVAFLIKAAIWPLNAWLVPAYTATSVPVAALFVLMTKVGIYSVLRVWTLLFSAEAGASAYFGGPVFVVAGLATLAFGAVGLLASIRLDRIAAFSVIVSSGTLLAAIGIGSIAMTAAALFYLASATLAASGLFLMVELVKRTSVEGQAQRPESRIIADEEDNLDDQQLPLVGVALPIPVAALGVAYVACALLVAGLPPLSGFIAKLALLTAALQPAVTPGATTPFAGSILVALLLFAGLAATVSLTRAGIRHFWSKGGRFSPRLRRVEGSAVVVLVAASVLVTVFAEPVARYTNATARYLHDPRPYIHAVLGAVARPGPVTPAGQGAAPP
jgi:multicomponent K+:H+ antiporter subunit D